MRKILIANRGEIAVRLILACRELGLSTVAVYAEPDAESPHAWLADEAIALAGSTPAETYLDAPALLEAAKRTGCDALHPGYGFLSENAGFAAACAEAGLTFVGPPPSAIAAMGHKLAAREAVAKAGVPVPPGGPLTDDPASWPTPADYPVMVKAAGGGGGMGLRRVDAPEALPGAITDARIQCAAAFNAEGGAESVELYWETYLVGGRHIEVQVAADRHGAVAHLGERECSIQRRYQKILEESPSPALTDSERDQLGLWAVQAASAVGYANVGTVEFLWTADRGPLFLEMNTRLQVEHPVTELVTGVDLPIAQLQLAMGRPLTAVLPPHEPRGHAIEARVYAEDPDTGAPAPGRIDHLVWPLGPWIRVDAGVEAGSEVSPYYDPLLAKIIAWGPDRASAVRRLSDALARTLIVGTLKTNLSGLRAILADEAFLSGDLDTQFLTRRHVTPSVLPPHDAAAAAFLANSAPALATSGPASADNWARRRWR
ncbi:Acetyl-/propionyl-coenzyme A carboxylase alpha chain [compost metagenome]